MPINGPAPIFPMPASLKLKLSAKLTSIAIAKSGLFEKAAVLIPACVVSSNELKKTTISQLSSFFCSFSNNNKIVATETLLSKNLVDNLLFCSLADLFLKTT